MFIGRTHASNTHRRWSAMPIWRTRVANTHRKRSCGVHWTHTYVEQASGAKLRVHWTHACDQQAPGTVLRCPLDAYMRRTRTGRCSVLIRCTHPSDRHRNRAPMLIGRTRIPNRHRNRSGLGCKLPNTPSYADRGSRGRAWASSACIVGVPLAGVTGPAFPTPTPSSQASIPSSCRNPRQRGILALAGLRPHTEQTNRIRANSNPNVETSNFSPAPPPGRINTRTVNHSPTRKAREHPTP